MMTLLPSRFQKFIIYAALGVLLPSISFADDPSVADFSLVVVAPAALIAGAITAGIVRAVTKRVWIWFLIPVFALGWYLIIALLFSLLIPENT